MSESLKLGFTKDQLDAMVWDADVAQRSIIGEGVLSNVCSHVKVLAAEVERLNELVGDLIATMPPCPEDDGCECARCSWTERLNTRR